MHQYYENNINLESHSESHSVELSAQQKRKNSKLCPKIEHFVFLETVRVMVLLMSVVKAKLFNLFHTGSNYYDDHVVMR